MSAGANGAQAAAFKAQDVFRCPELDVRMKKYLVRLANETANHLIRDTLEPNMHRDDDDDKAREDDGVLAGNDDDDGQPDARAAATNGLLWKKLSVVKGIQILRGYDVMLAAEHAKDGACCLRGVSEVNASVEEFAMLFKLDSNRKFAEHGLLFNPDLLDMATLYALVQPSGDHPRRYVGIKWCLVQSPSKLFRNRDFCYLECQKEFRDAQGRRGWVRSMHSIKMPCCPSLEKSHSIVRASMYRCGLTAVESDKPGVLNVTYTIEMDLKGHFPEIFQPSFISQRIATLASIDKFLQQQRLSSSPLLGDLDLPAALTNHKNTCHLCYRAFSTFTRRVVCRKCGQGVCKSCSGDWELDIPVIGKKKVRICTVCSAEARYSHVAPRSARARGSASLPLEAPQSPPPSAAAVVRRDRRSLSFNSSSDFHHLHHHYRDNGQWHQHAYDAQQPQRQPHRRVRAQSHRARPSSRLSSYHDHDHRHHLPKFQSEPSEAAYEQYRPTYENRETTSDPFFDEYTVDGMGNHHNVRATTDLTGMWDPREEGFPPAAMPSPASYFGARRLSFAPSPAASGQPPQRQSQKIGPIRDSILFQQSPQPAFEEPPRDSYSEHQRRQSDFSRFQQRHHTTNYGPSSNHQHQQQQQQQQQHQQYQHQHPEQSFPYFGYQDQQQQQLRRRQQSYPFAAEPFQQQQQNIRQTDIYPPQRHRQQSESEMHFPTSHVNGSSRNFALEFFHEQYRNSNKPRSNSTASLSSNQSYQQQLQQQYRMPSPGFVPFERRPSQNNTNRYFETIYSEPDSQHEHQQQHQEQQQQQPQYLPDRIPAPLPSPDQTQTAGEVVEYVETPDGEWVEQRHTIDFPQGAGYQRGYSGADDEEQEEEEEEEVLNPGFCIYCGSKRVIRHGVIESTCTCELGGLRDLENRKNGGNVSTNNTNSMFQLEDKLVQSGATITRDGSSFASENRIQVAVDVDQVIPLLMERMSQQSLHAYPVRTQSSYSE